MSKCSQVIRMQWPAMSSQLSNSLCLNNQGRVILFSLCTQQILCYCTSDQTVWDQKRTLDYVVKFDYHTSGSSSLGSVNTYFHSLKILWHGDCLGSTTKNCSLLPNPIVQVGNSKWTEKPCSNKMELEQVLRPNKHKTGLFTDVLSSQSLARYWKN